MSDNNGRYILFLIESKLKEHDGKIFISYHDAKDYAIDCIRDNYADKFVIGFFVFNPNEREMYISAVETFGFKNDPKNIDQLSLFGGIFKRKI